MRPLFVVPFLIFTSISTNLYAMMESSHSGVFSSTKAINEMVKTDDSFLYRFDAQSVLSAFVGEMSLAKRIWGHYSISAEVQSSLSKKYTYHSFEASITRGFTDNKIYGLLSVGYRMGYFSKKEQWLVFSTGTGFIPKPWGLESSLIYYHALTRDRCSRLRGELYGLYRLGGDDSTYWDIGLQTSLYIIPSGELGSAPDTTGVTKADPLIEEFMQIEGGLIFRYTVRDKIVFTLLVTNVIFMNQTAYAGGFGAQLSYAPKAFMGLAVKF